MWEPTCKVPQRDQPLVLDLPALVVVILEHEVENHVQHEAEVDAAVDDEQREVARAVDVELQEGNLMGPSVSWPLNLYIISVGTNL